MTADHARADQARSALVPEALAAAALEALEVRTTDYHTAGEPFRIVTAGAPDIPGATVAERRQTALRAEDVQRVRAMLCHEPRGHADMYGGFVVPPDDDDAHLGVLFWHKDGFSTACGHGTIALGAWAVESGLVPATPDGDTDVVVDVPSGRVLARVRCEAGRVVAVTFRNVPSYVVAREVPVVTSRGRFAVDVVYGGAIYATLPAAAAGLAVTAEHYGDLIALGREIKWALDAEDVAQHPDDDRLSGIYGTIWVDELESTSEQLHQRNVTVFADGEVDRSPCGSGTAARVALLAADHRLPDGVTLRHDSIVGTTFIARVAEHVRLGGRDAVVPEVTGMAYRTGEHTFVLDPHDPVGTGFVLR